MPPAKHRRLPVVGVPTCRQTIGDLDYDCTQHKYIAALQGSAGVLPLQIPLLANAVDAEHLLDALDGLLLTGSHSNIHPRYYENAAGTPDYKLDEYRDATIIPLVKPAIERGIPLFAICRGFQELNVAYGGQLTAKLHETGDFIEHRENKDLDRDSRYAAAHEISLVKGGKLAAMLKQDTIMVNSLHEQGVRKTGEGLIEEAHAEDGLLEAVSVRDSRGFAIGVQWHPEWKPAENPVSTILFSEFGSACARYMQGKI